MAPSPRSSAGQSAGFLNRRSQVRALPRMPKIGEMKMAKQEWDVKLDKYQRDNLLWLLNICGYPGNKDDKGIEPFTLANNGDWLGEIANQLVEDGEVPTLKNSDVPNMSIDDIREAVRKWKDKVS